MVWESFCGKLNEVALSLFAFAYAQYSIHCATFRNRKEIAF